MEYCFIPMCGLCNHSSCTIDHSINLTKGFNTMNLIQLLKLYKDNYRVDHAKDQLRERIRPLERFVFH